MAIGRRLPNCCVRGLRACNDLMDELEADVAIDNELAVLRAVRLKGRVIPDAVAVATGTSETAVVTCLDALVQDGSCAEVNGFFRVTPEGRERLDVLLARERENVDTDAIGALYEEFHPLNSEIKELANAWQIRDGEPNDHSDAAYDQDILDRLAALHERVADVVLRMAEVAPRLAPYPGRLDHALLLVQQGDHSWFLRPIADSYHTVWFELHEDLIGLAGLTREGEAAAGRAE